jgi:acetylornithine deacetylase/succinyl-diaminopimelate desuccinylase-like protein
VAGSIEGTASLAGTACHGKRLLILGERQRHGSSSDVTVTLVAGGAPSRTGPDDPFLALAAHTAEPVYGAPMQIVPMIGGLGLAHAFIDPLGVPIATAGLGHAGARIHVPDENLRVDDHVKHAKHVERLLDAFAIS